MLRKITGQGIFHGQREDVGWSDDGLLAIAVGSSIFIKYHSS